VKYPDKTEAELQQRDCAEMGIALSDCAAPAIDVRLERGVDNVASDSRVTVTYQLRLITALIADHVSNGPIPLRGTATFPGYTQ
jgi:hypothetical protein